METFEEKLYALEWKFQFYNVKTIYRNISIVKRFWIVFSIFIDRLYSSDAVQKGCIANHLLNMNRWCTLISRWLRQLKTDIDLEKYIRHFHQFLKINHAIFLLTAIWTHMSRTLTSHHNFCKSKHAQKGVTRVEADVKEIYMKTYRLRFDLPSLDTVTTYFHWISISNWYDNET